MSLETVHVGFVGLGANCRLRHVPGLRACPGVEIVAVCNRRADSTARAAAEFGIPKTFARWEELVAESEIDAVVIGTWPYLHCPITRAALDAGKHVLTEARMAMNAAEAHQMLQSSQNHPELVTQIVPSPFGLRCHHVVKKLLADGYIGSLREAVVLGAGDSLADPSLPLSWRQVAELSGVNMLTLGILHETLIRWIPNPVRVIAQCHSFVPSRADPETGQQRPVGTPDSVRVLSEIPGGARGLYHFSGVTRFGPGSQIHLYGSDGTLKYLLSPEDHLLGGREGDRGFQEIQVPKEEEGGWRVEADFIEAIRGEGKIELTDFATGVRYMEFTEAVARSCQSSTAVELPLKS